MFYFLIGCYFIIVDTEGQLEIFTKTKTYTNFSNKVFSNCFFFNYSSNLDYSNV